MNWFLTTALFLSVTGADAAPKTPEPVDFDTQVAPILSKAGCNAAACHGSAAGRGGFKLSLFGGDPASDFEAIVRDREGRRLRYDHPEDSLLLAKPGGQLEHEGGFRIDPDGPHAAMLVRWIHEGAQRRKAYRLQEVRVEPQHYFASALPARFPLQVVATFVNQDGDAVERDVTDLAVYEPSDQAALAVDENGQVEVKRKGRSVLVIRFLSQVLTARVTAPLSKQTLVTTDDARKNWIDVPILESLRQLGLRPSPQADPQTLLRRVTLDLTGRLPTEDEARAFAADERPDRYGRSVERLLASEAFNDYWAFRLMMLLRVGGQSRDQVANQVYADWLREQVAERRPLNQLATELLTSSGDSHTNPPANFFRTAPGALKQAEFISESLMGVRLRCANCHNHPLDKWTQDDYHGLAAMLANIEAGQVVRVLKGRNVLHPKTNEPATPRIPGERNLNPDRDNRDAFAGWLTNADNPYFAKSIANRVWKAMMGRGLVEPVDDLRDTNPATHPELLETLQRRFVDHDYRLRPLLREIVNSAAYQRSTTATAENESDNRFYSHALTKPLPAEVHLDAICDVTGVEESYDGLPGDRAVQLANPTAASKSLDVLGRCGRDDSCEVAPGETAAGGLSTRLHLLNGKLLNAKITDANGTLRKMQAEGESTAAIVDAFYWKTLSRAPRKDEMAFWISAIGDGEQANARLEDFVWSLLSSNAFSTNH